MFDLHNITYPTTGNPLVDWLLFMLVGFALAAILYSLGKREAPRD